MSSQQSENERGPLPQTPLEIGNAPRLDTPPASTPLVAAVPTIALDAHHADFASFHEDYVRHYIQLADAKAGVCFGAVAGVVAYLLSQDPVQTLLLAPTWTAKFGVVLSAFLFLFASAGCAFAVIAPRMSSATGEGIVFFGAVAKRASGDAYMRDVSSCSPSELTAVRLKHSYDVSQVCARKYAFLKKAIWLALPALCLSLLAILLV